MKTLFLVTFLFLSQVMASGWMDVRVLPQSVFTQTENGIFALFNEKGSIYPSERYECRLSLQADSDSIANIGTLVKQGSWMRWLLQKEIHLQSRGISHRMVLTPDRSSECLQWGPDYFDEGFVQRDCLQYSKHFQTMKSTLQMEDANQGVSALLSCEEWMSPRALEGLNDFFFIIRRFESKFPLFLKAELD